MKKSILLLSLCCLMTTPATAKDHQAKLQHRIAEVEQEYKEEIQKLNANEKLSPEAKELLSKHAEQSKDLRIRHAQERHALKMQQKSERKALKQEIPDETFNKEMAERNMKRKHHPEMNESDEGKMRRKHFKEHPENAENAGNGERKMKRKRFKDRSGNRE